jgi:serine/threonine-protein kinase
MVAVPRKRAREFLRWAGGAVVLFAIGYLIAVFLLFPPPPVPKDGIVVPNLAGQTIDDARERLAPLRLELGDTLSLPHARTAPGLIIAQSPLPGQQLRAGGRVALGLSAGPPSATVPDVVGLGGRRAENLLKRLGFDVEQSLEASDRPNGTVIRSNPEAGQRQSLPARVRLAVSAGRADTARVDTLRRDTLLLR